MSATPVTRSMLLEHFERLSESPDAVAKLRRFVLGLAVSGRLTDSEPGSWESRRLDQCARVWNGRAYKQEELLPEGTPVLRIQNLNGSQAWYYSNLVLEPEKYCDAGDLLYAWSGTFGPYLWQGPRAIFHYHIWKLQLHEGVDKRFLMFLLKQLTTEIKEQAHGLMLPHMTKSRMESWPVVLPPAEEQRRIVAKVDELMALCDELEAAQTKREKRRDRLVAASLHALTNGDGSEEGVGHSRERAARFYLNLLPRLTTRPEHIHQLRQTILDLAVRGRLVRQTPGDEPASALIARIPSETSARRAGAASRSGPVRGDPSWFSIPDRWDWARLGALIVAGPQNGISPKPSSRPDAPRAATLTATTQGFFDPACFKHVEADVPASSGYWLSPGDLLFQRGNTREYVGISAVYDGEPNRFLFPDLMIKVRVSPELDLRYVHLATMAPFARRYFSSVATGAQASMPKINHAALVALPIPVPPLAEQHRIVARVNELMSLCDALKAQLAAGQTEQRRALLAMLNGASAAARGL